MLKLYFHSHLSGLVPIKVLRKLPPEEVSLPIIVMSILKGHPTARATKTNEMYEVEVTEKCGIYFAGHHELVHARYLVVNPEYSKLGMLSSVAQADVDKYLP